LIRPKLSTRKFSAWKKKKMKKKKKEIAQKCLDSEMVSRDAHPHKVAGFIIESFNVVRSNTKII